MYKVWKTKKEPVFTGSFSSLATSDRKDAGGIFQYLASSILLQYGVKNETLAL